MSNLYLSGSAEQGSNLELFLNDCLNMMGNGSITHNQGSLAWCESYAMAKALAAALNFINLMGNQLSPDSLSIFGDRYADLYDLPTQGNGLIPDNLNEIKDYISLKSATFGTLCSYSNVKDYVAAILGSIFIDLEYIDPNIQSIATHSPPAGLWISPLSSLLVRIWQPRDNQDNLIMDNNTFHVNRNKYINFLQAWMPAYIAVRSLNLLYSGNNSLPNYVGGNNVISGVSGTNVLSGIGTAFTTDFGGVALGFSMPIEVVDNNNNLQTFHIAHVNSDTSLTLVEYLNSNITNRTYRCLGIQMDVPFVLDNACFNI